MMKKLLALFVCSVLSSSAAVAQVEKAVQVGFFPPIGSDGMAAVANTYDVSFGVIGNMTRGVKALELASVFNVNTEAARGLQLAGVVNYSKRMDGMQLAGAVNYGETVRGLQLGTVNVAGQVNGVQLGVVNGAGRVNGVQLGVVNIARECDGVPIGLLNIVARGGKHSVEVFATEAIHTAVSFKLGVDRFYTIFSAGAKYVGTDSEYALGLGFGSHIDWNGKWGNRIELTSYSLTDGRKFQKDATNMLVQLKVPATFRLASWGRLLAGPALNMTISDYRNPETGLVGRGFAPGSMVLWDSNVGKTRLNLWAGLTVGVELL